MKNNFLKTIILAVTAPATIFTFNTVSAQATHWEDLNTVFRSIMGRGLTDNDYNTWKDKELTTTLRTIQKSKEYESAMKQYVADVYSMLLGRSPDLAGGNSWINSGPLEVYRSIKSSNEYAETSTFIPAPFVQFEYQYCAPGGVVIKNTRQFYHYFPEGSPQLQNLIKTIESIELDTEQIFNNSMQDVSGKFSVSGLFEQGDEIYLICGGEQEAPSAISHIMQVYKPGASRVHYSISRNSEWENASMYPAYIFTGPKEYTTEILLDTNEYKKRKVIKPVTFEYTEERFVKDKCMFLSGQDCGQGLIAPHWVNG
jgi:hypothetical protein